MLELSDIAVLLVAAVPVYFFWRAVAVHEHALHAVKRHVKLLDLQLLDEAVALRRVWLRRDKRQRLCVERIYQFEFSSTRVDRYNGRITMLDDQVADIQLEPYRIEPLEYEPVAQETVSPQVFAQGAVVQKPVDKQPVDKKHWH